VVGCDTAERIVAERYYCGVGGMIGALEEMRELGVRFLVAARPLASGLQTLEDIDVPPLYAPLFRALPVDAVCLNVSSTAIRDARMQGNTGNE
jgi:hypothetical protein